MVHKFFIAFIPIFVAIDVVGLVAMFMGLAGDAPREKRQREGFIAIFTALCVSVGFIFLGKIIFTALGITVADFQVAGGLILLGLAGRELLNVAPASREATDDFGVVPLGMPLIAGPAIKGIPSGTTPKSSVASRLAGATLSNSRPAKPSKIRPPAT